MGFVLVFFTYMFIGIFGYFGFMGVYFAPHMLANVGQDPNGPLTQNCIQMFQETDVLGFLLRIVTFLVVFSAFPILHHFFRAGILKVFFESKVGKKRAKRVSTASFAEECQRASRGGGASRGPDARSSVGSSSVQPNRDDGENVNGYIVGACTFNIVTVFTLMIPLSITVFYPQIASILSYVGSVAGLFMIYFLPIGTYLTKLKNDSDNPVLFQAQQLSHNYQNMKLYQSKVEPTGGPGQQYQELNQLGSDAQQGEQLAMRSSSSEDSLKLDQKMFNLALKTGRTNKKYWNESSGSQQLDGSSSSEPPDEVELRRTLRRKFYIACFTHGLIVVYGLAVFAATVLH